MNSPVRRAVASPALRLAPTRGQRAANVIEWRSQATTARSNYTAKPSRIDRSRARLDNLIVAMLAVAALVITAMKLAGWLA